MRLRLRSLAQGHLSRGLSILGIEPATLRSQALFCHQQVTAALPGYPYIHKDLKSLVVQDYSHNTPALIVISSYTRLIWWTGVRHWNDGLVQWWTDTVLGIPASYLLWWATQDLSWPCLDQHKVVSENNTTVWNLWQAMLVYLWTVIVSDIRLVLHLIAHSVFYAVSNTEGTV